MFETLSPLAFAGVLVAVSVLSIVWGAGCRALIPNAFGTACAVASAPVIAFLFVRLVFHV